MSLVAQGKATTVPSMKWLPRLDRFARTLWKRGELRGLVYTLHQWGTERTATELLPCPRCHRTFLYGAYELPGRRYRLCKFCGLYQEPGEKARQAQPCAHRCDEQQYLLGVPYIQWHPEGDTYTCFDCGQQGVSVHATLVPNPYETAGHPWRVVPADLTRAYLAKFLQRLKPEADFDRLFK